MFKSKEIIILRKIGTDTEAMDLITVEIMGREVFTMVIEGDVDVDVDVDILASMKEVAVLEL